VLPLALPRLTIETHFLRLGSHDSSVSIVTRLRVGRPGFDYRQEQQFYSLSHRVQTGSGAQPAFYPVGTGGGFRGVNQPGREADHSPPSSAEVKNAWSYSSTQPYEYIFVALCLIKHWIRLPGLILS
jgi:hypothetical protein